MDSKMLSDRVSGPVSGVCQSNFKFVCDLRLVTRKVESEMKSLRTAPTSRLLAVIAGLIVVIAAGAAIAVASTGSGPVPKPEPLATAVHQGLSAAPVKGISADIKFTNNLIDSADFTSDNVDPILQGASGRLWISANHQLRIELQSNNGDAQVVLNKRSFWISDPTSHTVYEGTLPADTAKPSKHKAAKADRGVPSVSEIQKQINRVLRSVDLSGATVGSAAPTPGDVAGRPAYTVSVSPKHDGGLLGSAQLAWDAVKGVPLEFGIYARNDSTPVLDLKATSISYGNVPSSVFSITPPADAKVVKVSTAGDGRAAKYVKRVKLAGKRAKHARKHSEVSGATAVSKRLPFALGAPKSLAGLPRQNVKLLSTGGKAAALITYGQNLGGVAVIEQKADSASGKSTAQKSDSVGGLSLPTVSINGATGQELATALGTVIRFTSGKVAYTVIGSVPAPAAESAARAITTTKP
jgi:outer membrane lipoprotein-sorting protein